MTNDHLVAALEQASFQLDAEGWFVPQGERFLSLYAAHDGVPLTVNRVEAIRFQVDSIQARTKRGELFFIILSDLFALALEAESNSDRKTGFASDR